MRAVPTRGGWWVPAFLALALWANPSPSQARPAADEASLEARMRAFLTPAARASADSVAAFFPRSGDFTWVRTTHSGDRDVTGIWRFRGADLHAAHQGPLNDVFTINYHGQTVGSLAHQIQIRGSRWRRVPGNRFVPADAPDSSPIYVQWRREDGRWVVSVIGDEIFGANAPLPAWCC
ncbi:MAG TPA: hypothetical protein VFT45_20380 [Longimicrobium sp.]|nr:hypothetical protein [Longimicrobium sp.]